ncbi:MAG: DUF1080 domain-containing protein [Phycisphaerales bacterium JB063]
MKIYFPLAILAALALTLTATLSSSHADAPEGDGWVALFDGESIDDWVILSGKATYRVEDGAIVGTTEPGSPNTFLCTPNTYGDFELRFEVKVDDNPLNSGVQIRSKTNGNPDEQFGGRLRGPQVEIEAGPGQSGFIYGEASGGWLSPEPQSDDPDVNTHDHFKNGEWNTYRVLAEGPRIRTWINGHLIADLTVEDRYYADYGEGVIGLQVHGVGNAGPYSVRWRELYIREIE